MRFPRCRARAPSTRPGDLTGSRNGSRAVESRRRSLLPARAACPAGASSFTIDDGERLLLLDPLAVPDELVASEREPVIVLTAGDRLAIGIEAYAGREHNDRVLWNASVGAVIAGDSLPDFGAGLALNEGLRARRQVERLRPLLDLPVEVVCPAHGTPTDRAALARALAL